MTVVMSFRAIAEIQEVFLFKQIKGKKAWIPDKRFQE